MGIIVDMVIDEKVWGESPDTIIIGVDEVGRGALAGPIVGCACAFSLKFHNYWLKHPYIALRDSKLMTANQRSVSSAWLQDNHVPFARSEISAAEIDHYGIQEANRRVLTKSVEKLLEKLHDQNIVIVVDNMKLHFPARHTVISTPRAESQSLAVASASILAKVYRDQLMEKLSITIPNYGWERNKGYGTTQHREAIKKSGATSEHRETFLSKIISSAE